MIVRLPIVLFTGQPHYFYLHCYLLHLLSSSLFVGRGSVCALFVSHPCETLDTHAKASLPPYERSVGFASCKAFGRSISASMPNPKPLSPGKGYITGATAQTKQGCLQSAAQSHCTMRWHKWLTTCTGATPQSKDALIACQKFCTMQNQQSKQ